MAFVEKAYRNETDGNMTAEQKKLESGMNLHIDEKKKPSSTAAVLKREAEKAEEFLRVICLISWTIFLNHQLVELLMGLRNE